MTIDDNSNKFLSNPEFLAKPKSGRFFHISSELIPLKSEKGFPLSIDVRLKSRLRREKVSMKTSVHYHQCILGLNNGLFVNIANITLTSLWVVAKTGIL